MLRVALSSQLRGSTDGRCAADAADEFARIAPSFAGWPALLSLAEDHRVTPLLARAVDALSPDDVPAGVVTELAARSRVIAAQSLGAVRVLCALLDELSNEGIPAIAWKGPAISMIAWGDVGLRTFDDLDVIVAPAHRIRAREVARRSGWRSRYSMSAAQESAIFSRQGTWELERPTAPTLLEIHWEFSPRRYSGRLPVVDVLARRTSLRIGGMQVQVPDIPDTLALLAQHATKHGWSTLEDIGLFAAILVRERDALPVAMERAAASGGTRAILLGCALASSVFAAELPESIRSAIAADRRVVRMAVEVNVRWLAGETVWRAPTSWHMAWTVGTWRRFLLLWSSVFDPTLEEWRALRLPDALVWSYPLFRSTRLLARSLRWR